RATRPRRGGALHWRAGVSGNDFTGHEVGARRRLAPTEHAVNQRRGAEGEMWQPRFFDRALRSVKEYNEKVEYIHLNPVRAGLVSRPEDWRCSRGLLLSSQGLHRVHLGGAPRGHEAG